MRMYVTTLTKMMSAQQPNVEFVILESERFPLAELSGLPNVNRIVLPGVPAIRVARIMYQNSFLPILISRLHIDALLATCNVLPLGCPTPAVVVIQSLQYFDHADAFGYMRGAYLRAAVRSACKHAGALICVSEGERRDLIRLTGTRESKIRVVHHGISPEISAYTGDRSPASPPYILCVATLYGYKNLRRLIEAFARVKIETGIQHRLRVVGGEADLSIGELADHARSLGIADDVDLVGALPHHRIPLEYARASAFVYPSLKETFGLPPLEAMAMGVPVVASRAPSIPEIVGDAAELVDPLDPEDIARGLRHVLLDSERAHTLSRLGLLRASTFTWEATARQTFESIRSVVR
jgi:glycosyltransferase involved in cell wall biosynthesis